VRDRLLLGALKGAYRDLMAPDRQPAAALFLDWGAGFRDRAETTLVAAAVVGCAGSLGLLRRLTARRAIAASLPFTPLSRAHGLAILTAVERQSVPPGRAVGVAIHVARVLIARASGRPQIEETGKREALTVLDAMDPVTEGEIALSEGGASLLARHFALGARPGSGPGRRLLGRSPAPAPGSVTARTARMTTSKRRAGIISAATFSMALTPRTTTSVPAPMAAPCVRTGHHEPVKLVHRAPGSPPRISPVAEAKT